MPVRDSKNRYDSGRALGKGNPSRVPFEAALRLAISVPPGSAFPPSEERERDEHHNQTDNQDTADRDRDEE